MQLTSSKERWHGLGSGLGILPIHGLSRDSLHTTHSIQTLITSTLGLILADRNSRTIFYFLCVNLCKYSLIVCTVLSLSCYMYCSLRIMEYKFVYGLSLHVQNFSGQVLYSKKCAKVTEYKNRTFFPVQALPSLSLRTECGQTVWD